MKRSPFTRDFSPLQRSECSILHTKMVLFKFWCAGHVFLANTYSLKPLTYLKNSVITIKTRSAHQNLAFEDLVCNMAHLLLGKGLGSLIKRDLFISLSGQTVMWVEYFSLLIVLNLSCKTSISHPLFITCYYNLHTYWNHILTKVS